MPSPARAQAYISALGLALAFFLLAMAFRAKQYGTALPNQQDSINYIRTVHQCAEAVRSGDYFPRLSTYDAGGRGYPLFQFYPPLSFLVPGFVCAAGLGDEQMSINATIALLYVAAGFAFLSLARNFGIRRGPGVIGAFALLTYPYLTHISMLNIPMFFGLCASVLLAAAVASFARRPSAVSGARVFAATAFLCLTHFLSVLLYLPFVTGLLAVLGEGGAGRRSRTFVVGACAMILGVLACSFQLGPTVIYGLHQYLRMSNLLNSPLVMAEFAERYTTLSNLLSPRLSESNFLGAPFMGEYGFQLGLAYVAGLFLAGRFLLARRAGRAPFALLMAVSMAAIALMNPAVVRHLPSVFGVFQFPTRFLGLVAVPGALLLAYAVDRCSAAQGSLGPAGEKSAELEEMSASTTALLGVVVIGLSSMATQYLVNEDNTPLTGFKNPVRLGQLLERPASTYSEEYLLDAYHFAT